MSTELSLGRRLTDVVEEYETKLANFSPMLDTLQGLENEVRRGATVGGTHGGESLSISHYLPSRRTLEKSLLSSAWRHIYAGLNVERLCSPADKKRFEKFFEAPKPFNIENIREVFGEFLLNPRQNMLRGLAEVFSGLDPAYKSHDKMKIGVKGLPKRVIISNFGRWGSSGYDAFLSMVNALATVQNLPLVEHWEMDVVIKHGDAMNEGGEYPDPHQSRYDTDKKTRKMVARGVSVKYFQNGNAHIHFTHETLVLVNKCLSEYYGDVLADCFDPDEARPEKRASTAVSKDLQYYPTPEKVVSTVLDYHFGSEHIKGETKVLEPSCGCGRFMDELKRRGAEVFGIEYDRGRAEIAKSKGHNVLVANFLETVPEPVYDVVVMNPPFSGKGYAKHLRHAYRFLKPGGKLISILPATAKYDHGIIDKEFPCDRWDGWQDLPVGSFSESGTNINTGVFTTFKEAA